MAGAGVCNWISNGEHKWIDARCREAGGKGGGVAQDGRGWSAISIPTRPAYCEWKVSAINHVAVPVVRSHYVFFFFFSNEQIPDNLVSLNWIPGQYGPVIEIWWNEFFPPRKETVQSSESRPRFFSEITQAPVSVIPPRRPDDKAKRSSVCVSHASFQKRCPSSSGCERNVRPALRPCKSRLHGRSGWWWNAGQWACSLPGLWFCLVVWFCPIRWLRLVRWLWRRRDSGFLIEADRMQWLTRILQVCCKLHVSVCGLHCIIWSAG